MPSRDRNGADLRFRVKLFFDPSDPCGELVNGSLLCSLGGRDGEIVFVEAVGLFG